MNLKTTVYGFPKIGKNRELKKAVESFWKGSISKDEFLKQSEAVNLDRYDNYSAANIDIMPSSDFSLYDFILDLSTMFGVVPERFSSIKDELDLYFAMARGAKEVTACEMTKWFDTNYHYIVPELNGEFNLSKNRTLYSYKYIKDKLGVDTKPVMVGPFTYVALSKIITSVNGESVSIKADESPKFRDMVLSSAKVYNKVLLELQDAGTKIIQLDEPSLVLDRSDDEISILIDAYKILTEGLTSLKLHVYTYYESLSHYSKVVNELPVDGIGLDFAVNGDNFENIKKYGFPKNKTLIAGIVSGRNPWKTDLRQAVNLLKEIKSAIGSDDFIISNAGPLFQLPYSVDPERGHLNDNLIQLLSFAKERLFELQSIKSILNDGHKIPELNLDAARNAFKNPDVQKKVANINDSSFERGSKFATRYAKQSEILNLPLLATTTIGSFPQTSDIRKKRSDFTAGRISTDEYSEFIRSNIRGLIKLQEEIGLDVLVHGEFERSDMVEFFGEQLDGYAFTKNGWVQSYGTRCVRPPVIYGDVSRPNPMTLEEIKYAQSLTKLPVKGMLTGPVTMLNWSFYRNDIPKKEVAFQIAIALSDEILDLEKNGIKIIQVDEPAFREGLPLKKSKHKDYLTWAVNAFKLSVAKVKDETQIHTHMCYSEFNEIISYIRAMDADVISIEASRSKGEILQAFEEFNYNLGIGVGVYDIHSPRVPSEQEIIEIIERSLKVIDKSLFWINPDCGLKTRGYEETVPALKSMVKVANILREKYKAHVG